MKAGWYICICIMLAIWVIPASAQDWQVVYQNDFSSDPSWVTNDSAKNYWNAAGQNYHAQTRSNGGQYVYTPIQFVEGNSYKLEFDISMARADYHGGGINFGLGDAGMEIYGPATFYVAYWNSSYGGEQQGIRGNVLGEFYTNSQGGSYHPGWDPIEYFSMNTWYHNVLTYDCSAGTLSLTVTNLSSGSLLGTQFKTGVGTFSGIDRLNISSIANNGDIGLTGEGYIDNVVLSTIPEPATMLLLGLGGMMLKSKRATGKR
jgi:hypothetical protein